MDKTTKVLLSLLGLVLAYGLGCIVYAIASNCHLIAVWNALPNEDDARGIWLGLAGLLLLSSMLVAINIDPMRSNSAFVPSRIESRACALLWLAVISNAAGFVMGVNNVSYRPVIVSVLAACPILAFGVFTLKTRS